MNQAGREKILSILSGTAAPVVTAAPELPKLVLPASFSLDAPPATTASRVYVEGGLVQSGMLTLISGPPKARKSYLLADLAVSIAGGGSWLQHKCGEPARVLLVDLELDPHYLVKRLKWIIEGSGEAGARAAANIRVLPWRHASIQDGANAKRIVEAIAEEAKAFKADVVLVDSIYMVLDGDESDPIAVSALLRTLIKLCADSAVVFTHHFAKGSTNAQHSKSAIDRASGSSYWSRFADVLIPITPAKIDDECDRVVLDVEPSLRHHAPVQGFSIEWTEGPTFNRLTEAQAEALKPVEAKSAVEARYDRQGAASEPTVLTVLVEQLGGSTSLAALRKAAQKLSVKGGTFDRALARLEKKGQIQKTKNAHGAVRVSTNLKQEDLPSAQGAVPEGKPVVPIVDEDIPFGMRTTPRQRPDAHKLAAWIALGPQKWQTPAPAGSWFDYPFFEGVIADRDFWEGQPPEGKWGWRDYLIESPGEPPAQP